MIIRSRAPLRIGLAGGGTDVSPYSDLFGGAILNATIDLYAYASLEPLDNGLIEFVIDGTNKKLTVNTAKELPISSDFELFIGVYNRIIKQFNLEPLSFRLTSYIEAPQGSGLGTSSTIVVSLLGAFVEWLKLPLGQYDIAHLAYDIERIDLGMSGGKQDQYAATFGGINYLEFYANDKVIVNPLQLKPDIIYEQVKNVNEKNVKSVEAMHNLKEQSLQMKDALLRGELNKIGEILHFGWQNKKQMAHSISNTYIDSVYTKAIEMGATGGKISGAGGGGFMFFYCPGVTKIKVAMAIETIGGNRQPFKFTQQGLVTWRI
jgi:D-glycero-alpha-D-manno-heptose-7-phosphate kinase